jgi:hypothetical protein
VEDADEVTDAAAGEEDAKSVARAEGAPLEEAPKLPDTGAVGPLEADGKNAVGVPEALAAPLCTAEGVHPSLEDGEREAPPVALAETVAQPDGDAEPPQPVGDALADADGEAVPATAEAVGVAAPVGDEEGEVGAEGVVIEEPLAV